MTRPILNNSLHPKSNSQKNVYVFSISGKIMYVRNSPSHKSSYIVLFLYNYILIEIVVSLAIILIAVVIWNAKYCIYFCVDKRLLFIIKTMSVCILRLSQNVIIIKNEGERLGMHIKGGLNGQKGNPLDGNDEGVFVSKINSSGAARRDGRLKVYLIFKKVEKEVRISVILYFFA